MEKEYSSKNNNSANQEVNEKTGGSKKNYLIFGLMLAIIAVLLVGVIYQFVCIKKLEGQLARQNTSAAVFVDNKYDINTINN